MVLLLYAGKGLWLLHPSVAATLKGETIESKSLFGNAGLRPIANWPKEVDQNLNAKFEGDTC